ncbi:MAG: DUF2520 domain-containing protein [Actinomycetota bacterium]
MRFSVIGPGRAGRSLAIALTRAGWELAATYGRGDDPGPAGGDGGGGSGGVGSGPEVDLVIIAVPDDAIAIVAAAVRPTDAAVLHCSGAKPLTVLAPHRRVGSVHPLISLPDPETGAERLADGASFAVAGDRAAGEVVAALGGRIIEVPDDRRALYHAAASVGANHLVALCAQVERLADAAGVPVDAYWNLMAATLDNVRATGARRALTGPAARGDLATIAAHLRAIDEAEHRLYLTLADAAADLADAPRPSDARER